MPDHREGWSHPGELVNGPFLAHNHATPIELEVDAGDSRACWWIGSPGYAWEYLPLQGLEGDVTWGLEPAGELELTITGATVPEQARIRIRRGLVGDNYPFTQCSPKAVLRTSGLPLGPYVATAEIGNTQHPLVLGECSFTIRRGTTTTATLAVVAAATTPTLRRLHGTLELPELAGSMTTLCLEPEGQAATWAAPPTRYGRAPTIDIELATMRHLGGRVWEWDAGEQFEGTWTARAIGWSTSLRHDASAPDGHRLVMPELCILRVRFVDADTGAPLAVDDGDSTTSWHGTGPNGEWWWASLDREAPNRFVATVPICEVRVDAPVSLMAHSVALRLEPGMNELVIRGHPAGGIQLQFRCGDEEVPWYYTNEDFLWRSDGTAASYMSLEPGKIAALEPGDFACICPTSTATRRSPTARCMFVQASGRS